MSTRHRSGSQYDNSSQIQRTVEMEDLPEHIHSSSEEQRGRQEHLTGQEHSRQAMEHSQQVHATDGDGHSSTHNQHGVVQFGHAEIAALAHQLWLDRGSPEGSPEEDWYRAAAQLRARNEH